MWKLSLKENTIRLQQVSRLALIVYVIAVYVLLLAPASVAPGAGAQWDKVGHIIIGLVLGALVTLSLSTHGLARQTLWVLVVSVVVAITTELVQGQVPGRRAEMLDALADIAGALMGLAAVHFVLRRVHQRAEASAAQNQA